MTFPKTHFPWPALWLLSACAFAAPVEHPGKELYQKLCSECHGDRGQGVEDEYDEPLTGEKSLEALARQIDRTMPEDDPDKTTAADSKLIAEYMYDAFYSPDAQARNNPPQKRSGPPNHRPIPQQCHGPARSLSLGTRL